MHNLTLNYCSCSLVDTRGIQYIMTSAIYIQENRKYKQIFESLKIFTTMRYAQFQSFNPLLESHFIVFYRNTHKTLINSRSKTGPETITLSSQILFSIAGTRRNHRMPDLENRADANRFSFFLL